MRKLNSCQNVLNVFISFSDTYRCAIEMQIMLYKFIITFSLVCLRSAVVLLQYFMVGRLSNNTVFRDRIRIRLNDMTRRNCTVLVIIVINSNILFADDKYINN
jgi:hypothetical protein